MQEVGMSQEFGNSGMEMVIWKFMIRDLGIGDRDFGNGNENLGMEMGKWNREFGNLGIWDREFRHLGLRVWDREFENLRIWEFGIGNLEMETGLGMGIWE